MQLDPKRRQVKVSKTDRETLDTLHAEIYERAQKMHAIVAKALGRRRKSRLRGFKFLIGKLDAQQRRPINDCFYSDDGSCGCYWDPPGICQPCTNPED